MRSSIRTPGVLLLSIVLLAMAPAEPLLAGPEAARIIESFGRESGLFVVIGCGEPAAPALAADLGSNGNSLVHAIAGDAKELAAFNRAIADAHVQGCVSVEQLGLATLPYRDYLVNVMVIMDPAKAKEAGFKMEEARRCLAPFGRLVTCRQGKVDRIEVIEVPPEMDVWTHRYHRADGIPVSTDKVFDLPVGFRWNAGLPSNFSNPARAANRYASTRAMVVDDGRCFTFSEGVYENLGDCWRSPYGQDQYLTCRDAFNGRFLWRKKIGDTYYGSLYIENLAPLISVGTRLYLAGADGKMLVVSTKTGQTVRELATTYIPAVIAAAAGTVVAATWKDGKVTGSIVWWDRGRLDGKIDEGTLEAYDEETGALRWKNDLLGTSMLIAEGRVYIVNRPQKGELKETPDGKKEDPQPQRPSQKVIAMDLATGKVLWEASGESFGAAGHPLRLEAAGHGIVSVIHDYREPNAPKWKNHVVLLSGQTGAPLDSEASNEAAQRFFRYREHPCSPTFRVNDIILGNRGGVLTKPDMTFDFGGARAACLTGTVPAYGSGYIAQNWCCCEPGQIQGLLAIGPIGSQPTPAEMEKPSEPVTVNAYRDNDNVPADSSWTSFRANAERSSSSPCDIPKQVSVAWSNKVISEDAKEGTVRRDMRDYLNTRLTAPVIGGGLAIVGDMDHDELIAVDLKSGKVAWRFMTAGRMDTSPTLYKGICLVGDHAGYVWAVKIKTGALIYRLRVAPQEKRMLSYGKVESVWPVVGGVMVHGGTAYASAGRTQGADGGIVVRAFKPETGQPLWARAIPQSVSGEVKSSPRQNDTLIRYGGVAVLRNNLIDLKTGELVTDKAVVARSQEDMEQKLKRPLSRTELSALSRKCSLELKDLGGGGLEGLHSWNWTRLGHRKFNSIGYLGFRGDTVSWTENHIATSESTRRVPGIRGAAVLGIPKINELTFASIGNDGSADKAKRSYTMPPERQVTCLAICNNVLLTGGAIVDKEGDEGFIQAINLKDATSVWDKTFKAKLSFNGFAVDAGMIIASFDDGSVMCLK